MRKQLNRWPYLIALVGMLSACGNKGDLYLPTESLLTDELKEISEVTDNVGDQDAENADTTVLDPDDEENRENPARTAKPSSR